jgi:hypothetical protein
VDGGTNRFQRLNLLRETFFSALTSGAQLRVYVRMNDVSRRLLVALQQLQEGNLRPRENIPSCLESKKSF